MPPDAGFAELLRRVVAGDTLSAPEMERAIGLVMTGDVEEAALAGFLVALRMRGETVDEIVGAARALRSRCDDVDLAGVTAIDMVGTGGDGKGSFNITTAASFVAAACGARVAKHGNRAVSSRSGSADVLEALGVQLSVPTGALPALLEETGFCFFFAPRHHAAMRHAGGARKALGMRTLFNLLGPLANPAAVERQLVGVYAVEWVRPVAEALRELGVHDALVVHADDGHDEITTTAATSYARLVAGGAIEEGRWTPADFGVRRGEADELGGGDAAENAATMRALLSGAERERLATLRDTVCANAAAALWVTGAVSEISEGFERACAAVDDGAPYRVVERYAEATKELT